MKLTEDDLEFLGRIGAWTHIGLKKKILSNQKLPELIEKRLEQLHRLIQVYQKDHNINEILHLRPIEDELQELLEESKK